MKNLFKGIVAIVAITLMVTLPSCKKTSDDYYIATSSTSIGTVVETETGYYIRLDDGPKLYVEVNKIGVPVVFDDGERLVVYYNILGDYYVYNGIDTSDKENQLLQPQSYAIQLNSVQSIQTKGLVKQSFIDADDSRQDSIGMDALYITEAWFGAQYLNLSFAYKSASVADRKHMVSLVYDDIALNSQGELVLSLHHNGYDDSPTSGGVWEYGQICFDISEILDEGESYKKIRLKWLEYQNIDGLYHATEEKSAPGFYAKPAWMLDEELSKSATQKSIINFTPTIRPMPNSVEVK